MSSTIFCAGITCLIALAAGVSTTARAEMLYDAAIISTDSGKQITLEDVQFRAKCQRPGYYSTINQEIHGVAYWKNLDIEELTAKRQYIRLYDENSLIWIKHIVFSGRGQVERIEFENHEPLSRPTWVIELTGQNWTNSCPEFVGFIMLDGSREEVSIDVGKIDEVSLEGPPSPKE